MTIPNLPPFFNMIYTKENGELTPNAQLYNDLMYQVLNELLNSFNNNFDNGLQVPNKTTAEITVYRDDQITPLGTTWYNTNLNKLQVKTKMAIIIPPTPGTIETVTST